MSEALFNARPLKALTSFATLFGRDLIKEDIILSLAEDHQGRIWAGTLGGGLRRIERVAGRLQDTLHLTRDSGLNSNIVIALALGADGSIWAATDEGVNRVHTEDGTSLSFSALDGLPPGRPVRDVLVDHTGIVWLAMEAGGVFRIVPNAGGQLQGQVQDAELQPVHDADIIVLNTPIRTVTDAAGHFRLLNLASGNYQLQIDGRRAVNGPFTAVTRQFSVMMNEDVILAPVTLNMITD